jgi:hypothetical protein
MEDSGVWLVKGGGCGFGIWDWVKRLARQGDLVSRDWVIRVEGVDGVYLANDRKDGQGRRGEGGVLEGERGLGCALPEASEQENEESELGEEEGWPDSRLREHMHGSTCSEDDGGRSEDGEKEEYGPRLRKVCAEGSPGGGESAADAAVRFAVMAEMEAELDRVNLYEIEVETKDRRHEEDNHVADEGCEKCVKFYSMLVDLVSPFALDKDERAEY